MSDVVDIIIQQREQLVPPSLSTSPNDSDVFAPSSSKECIDSLRQLKEASCSFSLSSLEHHEFINQQRLQSVYLNLDMVDEQLDNTEQYTVVCGFSSYNHPRNSVTDTTCTTDLTPDLTPIFDEPIQEPTEYKLHQYLTMVNRKNRELSINKYWVFTWYKSITWLIASAGFFVSGQNYSDTLQCYSCDLTIHKWNIQWNPWFIHADRSPNCQHLLQIRGRDYISQIQNLNEKYGNHMEAYIHKKNDSSMNLGGQFSCDKVNYKLLNDGIVTESYNSYHYFEMLRTCLPEAYLIKAAKKRCKKTGHCFESPYTWLLYVLNPDDIKMTNNIEYQLDESRVPNLPERDICIPCTLESSETKEPNHTMIPCGHLVYLCRDCTKCQTFNKNQESCRTCQHGVKGVVTVYSA